MSDDEIRTILTSRFGLDIDSIRSLPGEHDQNSFVSTADGTEYVFKLYAAGADERGLHMQDDALTHLAAPHRNLAAPRHVRTEHLQTSHGNQVGRLLSWVNGTPWSETEPTSTQLRALGDIVARTDAALDDFEHVALDRRYRWSMMQAGELRAPEDGWAQRTLLDFRDRVFPVLAAMPQRAIHNDANENNVIVDGEHVTLIDYGDLVRGPRIVSLGVAVAYAIFGQADPLAAARHVIAGYHDAVPLLTDEVAVLDDVVRTRLAMSVANAAHQVRLDPANAAYLSTSQEAVLGLIELLHEIPTAEAHATFRDACGFVPVAAQQPIEAYLASDAFDPSPMVEMNLSEAPILDWSTSANTGRGQDGGSGIDGTMPLEGPTLGRYNEVRSVYDTDAFRTPFGERRTLHLGIDVFVPAGTPVHSPLDGIIHACDVRDQRGDYGGVLIVEYRCRSGEPFWLLLGHLDHDSASSASPGRLVARGEPIGRVGRREENGGWQPHIHVQLFTDLLGMTTEIDGVARLSQGDVWRSISPNPAPLIVGVDRVAITAD